MTAKQLTKAVLRYKSVTGFYCNVPARMPAAFLVNMPWWRVQDLLPRLKLYKPKQQTKKHK